MKSLVILFCLLFLVMPIFSINNKPSIKDSVDEKNNTSQIHSPKKAAIMSVLLPGLGQAYNKKYWKMPIIYIGGAGLAYGLHFTHNNYVKYRDAYKYRIDNDPNTLDDLSEFSDSDLNTLQADFHRNRDLFIIGLAALYTLNIIDATVDAHLYSFDVGDNLGLIVKPEFWYYNNKSYIGTSFSLNLNKK